MKRSSTPRKALKILYEFHSDEAQAFSCRASTLRDAIALFRQRHKDSTIHQVLLMGRRGQWVPVRPCDLEVAA